MKRETMRCVVGMLAGLAILAGSVWFVQESSASWNPLKYFKKTSEDTQTDSSGVTLRQNKKGIELRFPVSNPGTTSLSVGYYVLIRDLEGNRIVDRQGKTDVPADGSFLAVDLGAVSLGDQTADLVKFTLSYTLRPESRPVMKGTASLYHLVEQGNLSATIPKEAYPGRQLRIPVVFTDARNHRPLPNRTIELMVTQPDGKTAKTTTTTDKQGSAMATFTPSQAGSHRVLLTGSVGNTTAPKVEGAVDIVERSRVLLSTDKPMYQPGQTLHLRALVLERPDMKAAHKKKAVFEVFDAKGNKVFRHESRTNRFGIASTTFTLGNQINMGTYKIALQVADSETEKSVTVDRYVLPKFDVKTKMDREFYAPGDKVSGVVTSRYFFGKPVSEAKVKLTFHDYQAEWVPVRVIEGTANTEGILSFDYILPKRLVGQPVEGGNASILLEIDVTDTAGQNRKEARFVAISSSPLRTTVVPEAGQVIPGVSNRFFVALSDPAGTPVSADCRIDVKDDKGRKARLTVRVDESGLAQFSHEPDVDSSRLTVAVQTSGAAGQTLRSFAFETRQADAQLLIRPARTIVKTGEKVDIDILSAGAVTDAFLDVTRDGQTLLMAVVPLKDGRGRKSLAISPDMEGTLAVSAYVLSARGEFVRDSRVLFARTASDLTVDISLDKDTYRPGSKASVSFAVKDAAGAPAASALGIHVVDEAVFALSAARPGLMKLFFALEEELLKPSYQIGPGIGLTLGQLLQTAPVDPPPGPPCRPCPPDQPCPPCPPDGPMVPLRVQEQAEAAIAAQGVVQVPRTMASSATADREQVLAHLSAYSSWLQGVLTTDMAKHVGCSGASKESFRKAVDKAVESRGKDPWGRKYTVHQKGDLEASIASLGPDGVKGTWDDVTVSIQHDDLCPRSGWVRGIGDMGGGGHRMAVKGGLMVEDGMVAMEMAAVPTTGAPAADKKRETRTLAESEPKDDADDPDSSTSGGEDTVRIRTWFPETLFVEDCLITDSKGKASLEIPLADSITTWRMSTVASDANGRLGGADQGIRVFQDFFVDVDFPVFLTKEDEVSFPVVVYNYLDEAQDVTLQVKPENWYRLLGESTATLRLKAGEVASIHVPVKVTRVGWHSLTVHANGSKGFADAVQRTVEVRPDGEETIATESGRFKMDGDRAADDDITSTFEFPKSAVEGSPKAWVQILPGLSSHVVQGMESMLRLPGGCFEQTTSSAWPNVLALKYMKDTEQGTPEIEMKAMQYVNVGYQRILTFECASGGFNWWQGDNPGNTILSALAIQMLRDTKQVYSAVDEAVLKRTYAYLEKTQKADGSWGEERHLHAGNENLGAGSMRGTCYVVWSLNVGGFETSTAARKGMQYITRNLRQEKDLYTQGMCAIALATGNGERSLLDDLLKGIREKARVDGDKMYWENKGMTLVNSYGPSANVEVTALMALAFLHAGFRPNEVPWIVNYLAATKDPNGNWGYNTQATVLALKTFIMAQKLEGGDTDATVSVLLNGEPAGQRHFDNANRDVVWQVEFPESRLKDKNTVTLRYTGKGSLGYQLVHSYFTPTPKDLRPTEGPLSIELTYDRREIKVNDTVTVKARMLNKDPRSQGMILVTLGIPPGFDVLTEDLDTQREGGAIQRYELTGRQVLLYLDGLPVNEPLVVEYRLKARYPVTAQTGEAEVGFYYNREVFARTPGTQIKAQ